MPNSTDEIDFTRLGRLILAWLVYFALHSLLASLGLKHLVVRERPPVLPAYRLAYNTLAALPLVSRLALTHMDFDRRFLGHTSHSDHRSRCPVGA